MSHNQPYLILDRNDHVVGHISCDSLLEELGLKNSLFLERWLLKNNNVYKENYYLIEDDKNINFLPDIDELKPHVLYRSSKGTYSIYPKGFVIFHNYDDEVKKIRLNVLDKEHPKIRIEKKEYDFLDLMGLSYFPNYKSNGTMKIKSTKSATSNYNVRNLNVFPIEKN